MKTPRLFKYLILTLLLTSTANAETLGERLVRQYQVDFEELGVRAGSMRLDPAVSLDATRNSNVFATNNDTESDLVTSLRPSLRLRNIEGPHLIQLIAGAELSRFEDLSNEDYEDFALVFKSDWQINASNTFGLSLSYLAGHEDRTNAESRRGINPTDLDELKAAMAYRSSLGRTTLGFELRHQTFNYGNTTLADNSILTNDDRDYDETYIATDIGLSTDGRFTPYIRLGAREQDYDVNNVQDRNLNNKFAHLGLQSRGQAVLSGEVYTGYAWNEFENNTVDDFNDFVYGADLSWWPSRLTNINGTLEHEVDSTTVQGADGKESTRLKLVLTHELKRYMNIYVGAGYVDNDYVNLDRKDTDLYGMIEITRDLGRKLRIGAAFIHNQRTISPDNFDSEYDQDLVSLFIRGRL